MIHECVQCGFCCTQSPCAYGTWNATTRRCEFLTEDMQCSKYEEIKEHEKDWFYPLFGSSCSSALCNEMRNQKIAQVHVPQQVRATQVFRRISFDTLRIEGILYCNLLIEKESMI